MEYIQKSMSVYWGLHRWQVYLDVQSLEAEYSTQTLKRPKIRVGVELLIPLDLIAKSDNMFHSHSCIPLEFLIPHQVLPAQNLHKQLDSLILLKMLDFLWCLHHGIIPTDKYHSVPFIELQCHEAE
jgi:hypothetical protein